VIVTLPTHVSFGTFVYLLALTALGVPLTLLNAAVTALAATLPDLDTEASVPGRLIPGLSRVIERRFGHRTLTHSALFMGGLAIALTPILLVDPGIYVCIIAGYTSHPILDSMTVNGVHLLYPFSPAKCVFPLERTAPHRYRVPTGSTAERLLCIAFLVACIPCYLIAHEGYERFIRSIRKTVEAAVKDYDEFSRDARVYADIEASDLLTKHRIHGTFEVIGALNDRTLVFRGTDGKLHTLGKEYDAEYAVTNAICRKGEPAQVQVRECVLANVPLGTVLPPEQDTDVRLFGAVQTEDRIDLPAHDGRFAPLAATAGTLKLNFATPAQVRHMGLDRLFVTSGSVTLRSIVSRNPAGQAGGMRRRDSVNAPIFERLVLESTPGGQLEVPAHEGDVVKERTLLARRLGANLFAEDRLVNLQKIAALEEEHHSRERELAESIRKAAEAAVGDSTEVRNKSDLNARGFLTSDVVDAARVKLKRSSAAVVLLRQSQNVFAQAYSARLAALHREALLIDDRERVERERNELRAPWSGVIVSVRQHQKGDKTVVAVVLRRDGHGRQE